MRLTNSRCSLLARQAKRHPLRARLARAQQHLGAAHREGERPGDELAPFHDAYCASGLGRSWILYTLGLFSVPPSLWNTVRVPDMVHSPLPFQPAFGSSMRPSTILALKPSGYGTPRSTILPSTTASSDAAPLAEAMGTFAPSPRVL